MCKLCWNICEYTVGSSDKFRQKKLKSTHFLNFVISVFRRSAEIHIFTSLKIVTVREIFDSSII